MTQVHEVLAKTLTWALENNIEMTVGGHKETGTVGQIEIKLSKNGVGELIRFYDIEDITRPLFKQLLETKALNLSLTRLVL